MCKKNISKLEEKLAKNNKVIGIRLTVNAEQKQFAYVFVKTRYAANRFTIHIQDRRHVAKSISILDCILDVQDELIDLLGVREFAYKFLNESKWILYGKNGEIREFIFGDQDAICQIYAEGLDDEFLELSLERKGKLNKELGLKDEQYYDLFAAI
ncbi:hypothetical protein BKK44_10275 [Bacillus cereus]|nr:hypothetical protein BKK44_10275 [Bacillus cereus]